MTMGNRNRARTSTCEPRSMSVDALSACQSHQGKACHLDGWKRRTSAERKPSLTASAEGQGVRAGDRRGLE